MLIGPITAPAGTDSFTVNRSDPSWTVSPSTVTGTEAVVVPGGRITTVGATAV